MLVISTRRTRLLAKARESALSAVRGHNDPLAGFRTESFIVLMVIAWNAMFQAMLERDGRDYWARDEQGQQVKIDGRPKVLDTWGLASWRSAERTTRRFARISTSSSGCGT